MHDPARATGLAQAVSVREKRSKAGQVQLHRPGMKRGVELLRPELASPAVMVSPAHCQAHPGLPELGKSGQGGEGVAGNDSPVLEPKIEQVAIDDQVARHIGHPLEEAMEGNGDAGCSLAEVRIGDNDHVLGEHDPNMALGARVASQCPD